MRRRRGGNTATLAYYHAASKDGLRGWEAVSKTIGRFAKLVFSSETRRLDNFSREATQIFVRAHTELMNEFTVGKLSTGVKPRSGVSVGGHGLRCKGSGRDFADFSPPAKDRRHRLTGGGLPARQAHGEQGFLLSLIEVRGRVRCQSEAAGP